MRLPRLLKVAKVVQGQRADDGGLFDWPLDVRHGPARGDGNVNRHPESSWVNLENLQRGVGRKVELRALEHGVSIGCVDEPVGQQGPRRVWPCVANTCDAQVVEPAGFCRFGGQGSSGEVSRPPREDEPL